jgi:serine/threonine protein kinase
MIGKGSFARVYLVEDKETKDRFAVKAFSKDYLLCQNKGKVGLIFLLFSATLLQSLTANSHSVGVLDQRNRNHERA